VYANLAIAWVDEINSIAVIHSDQLHEKTARDKHGEHSKIGLFKPKKICFSISETGWRLFPCSSIKKVRGYQSGHHGTKC
jgi:hypothetical protein